MKHMFHIATMSEPLESRILAAYDRLPAGERRLADVLLEKLGELAAYSATELAARAGTSKATAARLFRRLGYTDYNELRRQARETLNTSSPLHALTGKSSVAGGDLGAHLGQDIQNLTRTIESLRSDVLAETVKLLANARRIWVVGFRNNYALAHYARGVLVQIKPDVVLLPVGGLTVAEDLADASSKDVVLALGFRRRVPLVGKLLRAARASGAKTVLIAEPGTRETADIVLRCYNQSASLFDSYVAPFSLLNYLCSAVALAVKARGRERLAAIEALHAVLGDFDSPGNI